MNAAQFTSQLYATFPQLPASQQKHSVVIEGNYWNAGIHLAQTIEKMARAFHPEAF